MTKSFQSMTGRNCGCPLMTTVVEPPELLLLVLPTVVERARRREEPEDELRLLLVSNRLPPCEHSGGEGKIKKGEKRFCELVDLMRTERGANEGLEEGLRAGPRLKQPNRGGNERAWSRRRGQKRSPVW